MTDVLFNNTENVLNCLIFTAANFPNFTNFYHNFTASNLPTLTTNLRFYSFIFSPKRFLKLSDFFIKTKIL